MAVCSRCKKEMTFGGSCVGETLTIEGRKYPRIRFGKEALALGGIMMSSDCSDCHVTIGALHHLNCDIEECPKCGGQFLSCNCNDPFAGASETKQ